MNGLRRRVCALAAALITFQVATLAAGHHQARAEAQGKVCGGVAGIACPDGLWCDPRPGMCNARDLRGICVRSSPMCTREYRPVCGCNRKTYGNECERRAAKVAKRSDGPC